MSLKADETFVYGRTREQAQLLLAACDDLGVDQHAVRAVDSGFVVPDPVWARAEQRETEAWTDSPNPVF